MIKANFNTYNSYVTDSLYQWDKDQTLQVCGVNIAVAPEIHFTNNEMDRAIVRQGALEDGVITVKIPNSLLQSSQNIKAYIGIWVGSTFNTIETVVIPVTKRERPEGYELAANDEEYYSFNKLENRMANMVTLAGFNNQVANIKAEILAKEDALKAQIANIIAHNNDTASNSELIDLRTDNYGNVFASAGESVRNIGRGVSTLNLASGSSWKRGYVSATGTIEYQNDDYPWTVSNYIQVIGSSVFIGGIFNKLGNDNFPNVACYDDNKEYLGSGFKSETNNYTFEKINLPKGTQYIVLVTQPQSCTTIFLGMCIADLTDLAQNSNKISLDVEDQLNKLFKLNVEFPAIGNGFLHNNGVLTPVTNVYSTSDYYDVTGDILVSGNFGYLSADFSHIHIYDENKKHLGSFLPGDVNLKSKVMINLPANVRYIRVCVHVGCEEDICIFCNKAVSYLEINRLLNNYNKLEIQNEFCVRNKYVDNYGILRDNGSFSVFHMIPVMGLNSIIIDGVLSGLSSNFNYVNCYDDDKTFIGPGLIDGERVEANEYENTIVTLQNNTCYVSVQSSNSEDFVDKFKVSISNEDCFFLCSELSTRVAELSDQLNKFEKNTEIDGLSDIVVPSIIDTMEGRELSLYFANLSRFSDTENLYRINNNKSLTRTDDAMFYTPSSNDSDFSTTFIRLNRFTADKQEEKKVLFKVNHKVSGNPVKNVCICGDSLVDNGVLANEVYRMLVEDGDVTINQVGTRGPSGGRHEGRGGWRWSDYLKGSDYDGKQNAFWDSANNRLDFKKYCEKNGFDGIDYFLIALGTNDVSQGSTTYNTLESVSTIIENAKTFLSALLSQEYGYPDCKVAIGLSGTGAKYFPSVAASEVIFKKSINTLNIAYLETFDNGKWSPNVTCFSHGIMTNKKYAFPYEEKPLSARYPDVTSCFITNNVHPTAQGYKAWADGYYNKIRGFLTEDSK